MVGINIQTPWSKLLIDGEKAVETRSYHLPEKYMGETLALIETPDKKGKFKSRIIGTITFSHSFKYPDKQSWIDDYNRHKVNENDKDYGWKDDKPKYGWVVSNINKFDKPLVAPLKKGIIFTTNCDLSKN